MNNNIDDLIKNWHKKAGEEDDYFSKFIFEYLYFIAFLKKKKIVNTRLDREVIQKLKRDDSLKNIYLNEVKCVSMVKESWNKIIEELNNKSMGNVSRDGEGVEEIK